MSHHNRMEHFDIAKINLMNAIALEKSRKLNLVRTMYSLVTMIIHNPISIIMKTFIDLKLVRF